MIEKVLQLLSTIQALKNKVDQIKTEIEGMVRRILQALTGLNIAGGLDPPKR